MIELKKSECGLLVDCNAPPAVIEVLNNARLLLEVGFQEGDTVEGLCYWGSIIAYRQAQKFHDFQSVRLEGGQNDNGGLLWKGVEEGTYAWYGHHWIVLDDEWIVDPTIDQFDPKLPAIVPFPCERYKACEQDKVDEHTAKVLDQFIT